MSHCDPQTSHRLVGSTVLTGTRGCFELGEKATFSSCKQSPDCSREQSCVWFDAAMSGVKAQDAWPTCSFLLQLL